jgi:mono/diheme cytochrome c family protein
MTTLLSKLTPKNTLLAVAALASFNSYSAGQIVEHQDVTISNARHFEEQGGEAIYASVCQGCHMSAAQGAKGVAQYPALANDPKLAGAPFPIYMVLKGQGAMPGFAPVMSDQQVADVVNYIRSHFGNHYDDLVQVDDVKNMR